MQMKDRQTVPCKTRSYVFNPYVKEGFLQLSLEAIVPVQMCSMDSEQLSKRLEDEDV